MFETTSVDFDTNFTGCSLHDVPGSSNGVQAICSVGGTKKVQILQKSQMFVTNSSSGKGEEKNKSLLANGPLTIEGRHLKNSKHLCEYVAENQPNCLHILCIMQ